VVINCIYDQTSDNESHPGALKRAVPHIAGAVDALIDKTCVLQSEYCCAINHIIPVSHIKVVSYMKERKTY